MNLLKKSIYRLVHFGLYLAKPFLPYHEPNILKSVEDIIPILKKRHIKKVLLVTDEAIKRLGLTNNLETLLKINELEVTIFSEVLPNPIIRNADAGKSIYQENKCEAIISIGGGSVIDCAKAIGALVVNSKTLRELKGTFKIKHKLPLLIAIPTTAGTGSEATFTAVITDEENKHKCTINDFVLTPKYAVLDPNLIVSLPKHLTSTTGMDALTHAIEAYIGKSTSRKSRKYAEEAIKLIFENILLSYNEPANLLARENMLKASYLAGVSFANSYVGYIHAIAHTLGGKYNVPHGFANAVIMPYVLEYYGSSIYHKINKLVKKTKLFPLSKTKKETTVLFINKIKELNELMQIPNKIESMNMDDFDELIDYAYKEAHPLYPVPKFMDKQQMKKIYQKICKQNAIF